MKKVLAKNLLRNKRITRKNKPLKKRNSKIKSLKKIQKKKFNLVGHFLLKIQLV